MHFLLEMGFLVLSTGGAAVCTVSKILKMADEAGDIGGYRAFWHGLPPTKNRSVLYTCTVYRFLVTTPRQSRAPPRGLVRFRGCQGLRQVHKIPYDFQISTGI